MLAVARNNQKENKTMQTEMVDCPVCKGTGLDWNNTWPNGMASHCEECDGYGEVTK